MVDATGQATGKKTAPMAAAAVQGYIVGGIAIVASLFAGVGVWAARTNISGAVIAPATVVVDSNVKKIQHLSGGIVGAIHVRNGDRVSAGQLLIRLDDTQTRAHLQIITNQIDETSARLARLNAEQVDAPTIIFPQPLLDRVEDAAVKQIIESETTVFTSRSRSLVGQVDQLRERVRQLEKEISGLSAQHTAKARSRSNSSAVSS